MTGHSPPDDARVRQQLYDIFEDSNLSNNEKQRQALELGRAYLDVDAAHIQRHADDDTHEVVASVGSGESAIPEESTLNRASTYCRRATESHAPVVLSNAAEEGWADDPAHEKLGWNCHLGAAIYVDGDVYGTVCFGSESARESGVSAGEKALVELIGRLLGRAIEVPAGELSVREEHELTAETQPETPQPTPPSEKTRAKKEYEAFLQSTPNAVIVVNSDTGRIETANSQAATLTGYQLEALHGRPVVELHPQEHHERYRQLFDAESDEEQSKERFDDGTPIYVRQADGTDIPVEIGVRRIEFDAKPLVLGILRDISSRKARKEDLNVRNRAIEESTVGITIADAQQEDTPIIYANRGFERVTGYSAEELIGQNCRLLQGSGTDEETVAEIRDAIDNEEMIRTQILNYRANGTPFWNKLTIAPVVGDDSDDVTHFIGLQRDITAQKRRERLIEVLDRVLRHNLRNDMNVIAGFADVIATQADDDIADMAGRIKQTASELVALSETVRNFETNGDESESLATRNIVADVRTVVEELRSDYPETTFTIDAPETVQVVATDQLEVALQELGENAAKHTDSTVNFEIIEVDDEVTVHIRDTGGGLPDAERRVLEAGRETPLEHGSGLGLWLVNWIITNLGGSVMTGREDESTITIRLPNSKNAAESEVHRTAAFSDSIEQ